MMTRLHSLRNRFLLSLCGVLCLALLALVLVARYQIMPILLEDEESFAGAELDRAERALDSELNHMRRLVEDWAYWDDSYDFVSGKRPEYVDSNLYEDTLETLDLKMMLFLDADLDVHWVIGFDEAGEFTTCPGAEPPCDWATPAVAFLVRHIERKPDEATDTWLLARSKMGMAALSPIHQSREESSAAGWLAMVRPLDASWIEQLRDTTGIQLELTPAPEQDGPVQQLERISPTHMAAHRLIPALPPGRVVRIEALLPRQRYQASLETFRFALYWTGGVLIVTLLIVLWLLERMVLLPLRQFTHYTQCLHHEAVAPDMPDHLVTRRDEIGTLSREFRSLLEHQNSQSEQLRELSQHDPLTGVANRRLFDERFAQALSRPVPTPRAAAMMIDIDHFKLYNDHYGHQAGDVCLITLAQRMDQLLSAHGFLLARTGGEEFSVLLPGTSLEAALAHAEALLRAIEELNLPHEISPTRSSVTVSIGVAAHRADLSTPYDIMRAADQAMYQAKTEGRNRVEAYRVGEPLSPLER
ncbi:sensor domain-containing diguanylate cyclase [Billgrantia antri]|uniref:diguanylate cyclase n=1 Tax=Billgrantia antri TaxID=2846777 RepID=A0ABS6ZMS2_9GAMM|nr:diguanylate cyclase [Halomonas antri]MBW6391353.1 diguanylate cyclase [Halomonas antri]